LDATTTGNNISVTKTCALATCLDTSAEWIVERPEYSSTGIAPFAQVTPTTFTSSTATGGTITAGAISKFSPTQLEMIDSTATYALDDAGALNAAGTGFGVSWLNSY
jgi:acyl-CoA reductase-like NAD-dependent aldehyde dehydrogenase